MNIDRESHVIGIKLIQKSLLVEELQVDERYQRAPIPSQIKWITSRYDEVAFGRLLVAQRTAPRKGNDLGIEDITYWIIDGQQRWYAAKRLEMKKVPCLVFESLGLEHEAEVFKLINANRKGVRALDVFKAQLVAGDPEATEINRLVEEAGFRIENVSKVWNAIKGVTSLKNIYRRGGSELLTKTLTIINTVWKGELDATQGIVLAGLSYFLFRLDGQYVESRLKNKLKKIPPENLIRYVDNFKKLWGGAASGSAQLAMAQAICNYYNKGAKTNRLEITASQVEKLEEDDA